MTDGIIQKVFSKYTIHDLNTSNLSLADIQQELIEKIKQEFIQFNSWDRDLIQRILIGDNQE